MKRILSLILVALLAGGAEASVEGGGRPAEELAHWVKEITGTDIAADSEAVNSPSAQPVRARPTDDVVGRNGLSVLLKPCSWRFVLLETAAGFRS